MPTERGAASNVIDRNTVGEASILLLTARLGPTGQFRSKQLKEMARFDGAISV